MPVSPTYCPVIQWPEGLLVDECTWEPPCDEHRRRGLLPEHNPIAPREKETTDAR